ncbi:MAG: GntR family transcriptional regulator [Vicinamibacteria bacterium]
MPKDTAAGTRGERPPAFVTDAVPLYYQLGSVLREKILSGQFAAGQRLPTEADLSAEYGVSRITVRQALSALEGEGLIRREAGRGTFVSEQRPFTGAIGVQGSLDDLITMALTTSVQLLDLRTTEAGPEQAAALQIAVGAPLTRATRLRFHKDEPFSSIVNLLPLEIGRRIKRRDWKQGSVLKQLERMGYRLSDADQTVRAALADATLARLLKTRIGAPLLSVDRVVHADGLPIEFTHTYYRSDIYSIRIHLAHSQEQAAGARWSLRQPRKR